MSSKRGPVSRACDRCYAMKEKCAYSTGSSQCDRCLRGRRQCSRNREILRPGRKGRQLAPAGSSNDSSKPVPSRPNEGPATLHGPGSTPTSSEPHAPIPPSETLLPCTSPAAVPQREPKPLLIGDDILGSSQFRYLAATFLQPLIPSLATSSIPTPVTSQPSYTNPLERMLLERMLDESNFAQYMVLGPSFAGTLQKLMYTSLSLNPILKDIYLANYGSLAIVQGLQLDGLDNQENLRRGRKAVQKFRSCENELSRNIPVWLAFGMAIITFELCARGSSAADIRRLTLKHIVSHEYAMQHSYAPSELNCLIVFDIHDCLFRRQIPLIKPTDTPTAFVDSYIGLCASLLPSMYDACCLSYSLCHATEEDVPGITEEIRALAERVQQWQPDIPMDFASSFEAWETMHMLTQVQIYRSAILLFLHRLTHPFDCEDAAAESMAQSILTQLDLAMKATQRAPRCVTIPLLLAAIEARSERRREDAVRFVDTFVGHTFPLLRAQLKGFLRALWDIRDISSGFIWLDLVPHLPPVSIAV